MTTIWVQAATHILTMQNFAAVAPTWDTSSHVSYLSVPFFSQPAEDDEKQRLSPTLPEADHPPFRLQALPQELQLTVFEEVFRRHAPPRILSDGRMSHHFLSQGMEVLHNKRFWSAMFHTTHIPVCPGFDPSRKEVPMFLKRHDEICGFEQRHRIRFLVVLPRGGFWCGDPLCLGSNCMGDQKRLRERIREWNTFVDRHGFSRDQFRTLWVDGYRERSWRQDTSLFMTISAMLDLPMVLMSLLLGCITLCELSRILLWQGNCYMTPFAVLTLVQIYLSICNVTAALMPAHDTPRPEPLSLQNFLECGVTVTGLVILLAGLDRRFAGCAFGVTSFAFLMSGVSSRVGNDKRLVAAWLRYLGSGNVDEADDEEAFEEIEE